MDPLAPILGDSPGISAVREQVRRLLQRQAGSGRMPPVLIQGATGTGKGLVARAMHGASARAQGQFIDVNCAAIPETLLESEMFGVERGAFTDARQSKAGLFQVAHHGTIFLDEIGLLPEGLQAKLLKVIEERSVRRLGSTRSEPVDVWVIAATNEDLAAATRAGRFRTDLYHRLAVVTFALPALSERGDDIRLLAEHFLARACADYGIPPKTLTPAARAALRAYAWPGNIRELANLMERVALLAEEPQVTPEVLALPVTAAAERAPAPPARPRTLEAAVDDVEREHLLAALTETRWNVTRAAARLGISRNTLRYRIEKHGLQPGMTRPRRRDGAAPAREPAATRPAPEPIAPVPVRERRRLTLLRASVATDPESLIRVPSFGVLDLMADKVLTFGGRVAELNPSGAVAVFGLEPVEDAPTRAAHAAMAILNGVERARVTDRAGVGVRLGIHVDQFMVQAGHVPALDRDARLHAWAFLESLVARAEPGGIAISDAAAPFLERRFNLVPAPDLTGDVGRVFWLAGREPTPGLRLGGHLTPFVGRQHELDLLRSLFALAGRGQGQVVGITGQPGIGKSRLLHEFHQTLPGQDATYLPGQCASYGASIPFLPIIDMLLVACRIAPTDRPETAAEKIRSVLRETGLPPGEGAPYLLQLLGLKEGEAVSARLSPEGLKAGIFETLRQLAIASSRRRPLVLVLEDLQWIDETSAELVASIVEVVPTARILLLATYRPGFRPPWIEKSYATQMALQPLLPEESRTVVRALVGRADVSEPVVSAILAKAEGNALFLEELARSVRELGSSAGLPAVPDTVQEVLLARIDRLPPEESHLLRAAAVVGKDVPYRVIEAVAGVPSVMVRQGLGHLRTAEFLYETSLGPEPQYSFRHALTHEVAYTCVPTAQRRLLHAAIADAMARIYSDRLGEHVERLAHHALQGELWADAVRYLRESGAKAASRSAHREAVGYFEQALGALTRLPEGRQTLELGIDLRFQLRNSLQPLADFELIVRHLREAETLATAAGDEARLGRVYAYMTDYFRLHGDQDRAMGTGHRALDIAERLGDLPLRVATSAWLGQVYYASGQYSAAVALFSRNIESLDGELRYERLGLPQPPSVHSRTCLVWCLAELGEFARAIAHGEEAMRIAETDGHPLSLLVAHAGPGILYLRRGDLDKAIPHLEQALELGRRADTPLWFPRVASALGAAYTASGRVAEALPLLERAVEQAGSLKLMGGYSLLVASQSQVHLAAERMATALELARQALERAREFKERGNEAWALRILSAILMRVNPAQLERAAEHCEQALALADVLGMRPLVARCQLGLAQIRRHLGQRAAAEESLGRAIKLFRELEMRRWLNEGEAERRAAG